VVCCFERRGAFIYLLVYFRFSMTCFLSKGKFPGEWKGEVYGKHWLAREKRGKTGPLSRFS
jgi:hypothetical protein